MSFPHAGHPKPFLVGRGLVRDYGRHRALAGVDVTIHAGEVVAIAGPSGSGKTTLLHVLAGILRPDDGEVLLDGHRIDHLGEAKRSELRRREFGFVFQHGMLVGELTRSRTPRSRCCSPEPTARGRPPRRASGWTGWVWRVWSSACPASGPAARRSASPSPALSRTGRR